MDEGKAQRDEAALAKLDKFIEENKIALRISPPSLIQGETGLGFGEQKVLVSAIPEEIKEEPKPVEGEIVP